MQVDPDKCLLVTTHSWDVTGAHYAGMQTAYLDRPHQMLYPLAPAPHLVAKDLAHLVEAIA